MTDRSIAAAPSHCPARKGIVWWCHIWIEYPSATHIEGRCNISIGREFNAIMSFLIRNIRESSIHLECSFHGSVAIISIKIIQSTMHKALNLRSEGPSLLLLLILIILWNQFGAVSGKSAIGWFAFKLFQIILQYG